MTARVLWYEAAERDLAEAYYFYSGHSIDAGERLLDAVEGAVEFLRQYPQAGRTREFRSRSAHSIRSWRIKDFPGLLVFYRTDATDLEIIRIVHGARYLDRLFEDDEFSPD